MITKRMHHCVSKILFFIILQLVNSLPVGYEGGKRTRCTDRFVRYPYPKQMHSNYKNSFYSGKLEQAGVKSHKQAFNLEKETKIINPHKMDTHTTTKDEFKGLMGEKKAAKIAVPEAENRPINKTSSYQANYPNWKNGNNDVFHEREPQYPVYSVPFRGASSYK